MARLRIIISDTIKQARQHLAESSDVSVATRSMFNLLILIIELLVGRFGANSKNSSKPPYQDPNREKKKRIAGRKVGGQHGHIGTTLAQVENPDIVQEIFIDKTLLPEGEYTELSPIKRQLFDVQMSVVVTEYVGQVLENALGERAVCLFV